jgi:hypothetical protein
VDIHIVTGFMRPPDVAKWLTSAMAVAIIACARTRTGESAPVCAVPPAIPLAPFATAIAERLDGDYLLLVVAQSGPRRGRAAHGPLHLARTDTLHRYYNNVLGQEWRRIGNHPLMGWTSLEGEVGMATAGTPLDSRDSTFPGVVSNLDSLRSGLRFMLGYRPMLDGGGNEFVVTRVGANEFAGRWMSRLGYTTYAAAGYFCAVRVGVDLPADVGH